MDTSFIATLTVTDEPGSAKKISGEIPFEHVAKERAAALRALGKDVEMDGFRKGHVPEKILVERFGELRVLTEMAERALAALYPKILEAHHIDAVGFPHITITKLAPDNPFGFSAIVPVVPTFALPDYKAIAAAVNKEKPGLEVTDEDVDTQVKDILRQKLAYERLQKAAAEKPHDHVHDHDHDHTHDLPTPASEAAKAAATPVTDNDLPEITDDYVKTLGQPGQFTSVADFKEKLREHLTIEKERDVNAAHRAKLTDAIVAATDITLPAVLVDSEIKQMFAQMEHDLERANLKLDDYLTHIKKTKDDLIKEWTPAAETRAKLQLILNQIAIAETVEPNKGLVDEQVDALKAQYADADETRVRIYVETILQNDAVLKLLEAAA